MLRMLRVLRAARAARAVHSPGLCDALANSVRRAEVKGGALDHLDVTGWDVDGGCGGVVGGRGQLDDVVEHRGVGGLAVEVEVVVHCRGVGEWVLRALLVVVSKNMAEPAASMPETEQFFFKCVWEGRGGSVRVSSCVGSSVSRLGTHTHAKWSTRLTQHVDGRRLVSCNSHAGRQLGAARRE